MKPRRRKSVDGRYIIILPDWTDDMAIDHAMKLFEQAAPSDAYTRKGLEAVLKGMGLIADER
jgi:hypothetical protein